MPGKKPPGDVRFAVVGAGVSGLTAAAELRRAGFAVTVFEAAAEVGGKVRSLRIDGRAVEVGAVAGVRSLGCVRTDFDPIFRLAARYGLKSRKFETQVVYDLERGSAESGPSARGVGRVLRALWPLAKYAALQVFRWRGNRGGEIGELSPELRDSWSSLVERRRLQPLADLLQPLLTNAGYTPDMPAFYQTQYVNPRSLLSLLWHRGPFFWEDGYQRVYQRLCAELEKQGVDFRLGQAVERIEAEPEGGGGVRLRANGSTARWDEAVVACDVGPLLERGVLELPTATRELLARASDAVDYRTLVLRIRGLPDEGRLSLGHLPDNAGRAGQPMLYAQQAPGVYSVWFYGTDAASGHVFDVAELVDNTQTALARAVPDARVTAVEHHERWRYAPHASVPALHDRVLEQLRDRQGERGLTFLLAASSFEVTASVMKHARAVIRRLQPVWRAKHGVGDPG
jgi:phytoene dehydrogenase-like protein